MARFEGKVALITGAGRPHGIGRAVALRLASEGANVAVSDLCPPERPELLAGLEAAAAEVERLGGGGLAVPADVARADDVGAMVEQVVARFGRLDILVNNAGLALVRPATETTEAEFRRCLDVMVLGTFLCSVEAARHMLGRGGGGRIVNLASIHGLVGAANQSAYCAAKFGVVGLTRSLAKEWAADGIGVNAVAPGMTDTDMMADISSVRAEMSGVPVADVYARYASLVPAGRLGRPEEVAGAICYLASDEAAYVTGHVLGIDGAFGG